MVRKIVDRFAALGLDDIRVVPPEVANVSSTSYVDALLADSAVMAHVDQWGFHNYFGVSPALTSGQLAGRRLWFTEWSNATTDGWLDTGQDVANEWTFAETEADYLLNHLRDNASAALKWDAIDNVHEHDPSGAVSKWGALAYDFATQTMTPRKRLYTSAQVFRFVRPGMRRVGVSSSVGNLIAYAFYDPAAGRFALVGHNQGTGSATLNGSLASVGSPALLQAYTTNAASASVTRGSDVPVSGGSFSYSVPADTFFTLTTPVPAADSVAPSVSLVSPTGGDSLSGRVDVVAAATDNDGVSAVQFLLDGRPLAAMMTEPYATVLDTRVLANGAHAIAAMAWDRTGNTSTATIAVGVNNSTSRDLVAAYGFNETSGILGADISGNGHTGFLNGPTWTTAGKYGGALSFSGQSLLIVNDSQDLRLANGMTLEAWVRPSTSAGSQAVLLKERPGDVSYALYSAVSGGAGQAQVTDAVLTRKTSTTGTLPLNTWTYLAVTYDGTSLRAYINGTLSSTVAAGAIFSTNNPLFIGGSAYRGDFFSGLIDEVRIYNRALAPDEIATDMATPVVTDAAPPTVQLTAPLAGATVSGGAVSIAANASDDIGVVGVQFQIDGVNLGSQDSTAPYGTTWDSRTVANGTHVVTAIAKDAADKTGTSSVSVTVTNPPTISAVSAGPITGTSAIVGWTTNVPATSQVAFGPTAAYGGVTPLDEALVIAHAQTLTGLIPATRYHYQVLSTDAGGSSVASADFTFTTVDTVFPSVSLTAPIDGAAASGPSVAVSADAFDNVGIVGVQFKVDGANIGAEDQTSPYSVVWNTTGAANGPHTLTAVARDASGNVTASAPVSVTVANVAKAISVNFVGGSPTTTTVAMGSTESAGVVARTNWNNATGASRSTTLALVDETGAATTATLTWASDNTWVLPVADQAGSRRMMRGYLDTGSLNPATVTVAGLAAGAYDIYVYGDGDNGSATRSATYRLSGPGLTATSLGLTDAANTNFTATFTQAAGSSGNYVRFGGVALTSGFTITATPGTSSDPYRRASINGLQIVPTAPPAPDFAVSATPASRTIVVGTATTYTVNVSASNGFAGVVSLGVSGLPANTTAAFDLPTLIGSGSATLTVTTTASTPSSTSTVTVTGTSGMLQHSTTVSLVVTPPPDFTLAATPPTATTVPGGSVSYTVTIGALNGFAGVVSLGVSGLPTGASGSFNPASLTGGGTSTLTVTTGAATPIGSSTPTVTGTSGALTHGATVTLTLNEAGTGAISVNFVGTGTAMGSTEIAGVVARARWNNATGASRTSALALMDETGAPTTAGLTWSANATSRTPITDSAGNNRMMRGYLDTSNTSVTTVNVTGVAGTYDVYVYVDGNNSTASRTGSYRFSGAGITTTTITLTDAASTNFSGTFVQAANSSGNYVKFTGVSITSGFTIAATPGTASTSTRRAPINGLQLVPTAPPAPDFTVAVTPASRAIDPGGATTFAIDIGALNGFAGAVSLGVSGVPSGAAAAFNPNPAEAAGAGSATLTITTTTPPPGSSTLTITGTSGALAHTAAATLVVNATPGSAKAISVNFVGGSPTTTTVAMGSHRERRRGRQDQLEQRDGSEPVDDAGAGGRNGSGDNRDADLGLRQYVGAAGRGSGGQPPDDAGLPRHGQPESGDRDGGGPRGGRLRHLRIRRWRQRQRNAVGHVSVERAGADGDEPRADRRGEHELHRDVHPGRRLERQLRAVRRRRPHRRVHDHGDAGNVQ